jgi:hypothetical protein
VDAKSIFSRRRKVNDFNSLYLGFQKSRKAPFSTFNSLWEGLFQDTISNLETFGLSAAGPQICNILVACFFGEK